MSWSLADFAAFKPSATAVTRRLSLRRDWKRHLATLDGHALILAPRSFRHPKLHLGSGDLPLAGYLNVDLPSSEGMVPPHSKPDLEADIFRLRCSAQRLSEIRLHHVFEHFDRVESLALLLRWYDWLRPGGRLVLEVPDFDRCVENFRSRTAKQRALILRHLFGSQEAPWARHLDGWSERHLEETLRPLGFAITAISLGVSDRDHLLHNVTAHAYRKEGYSLSVRLDAARELLRESMNGEAASEQVLLTTWLARLHQLVHAAGPCVQAEAHPAP